MLLKGPSLFMGMLLRMDGQFHTVSMNTYEYHESYNALIYLLQCAAPPQCLWLIPYTTLMWCVDMGFWEQRFQTETCTLYISVHLAHALIQHIHESGQIIATSHDLTPIGGLVREFPLYQGNLGW